MLDTGPGGQNESRCQILEKLNYRLFLALGQSVTSSITDSRAAIIPKTLRSKLQASTFIVAVAAQLH